MKISTIRRNDTQKIVVMPFWRFVFDLEFQDAIQKKSGPLKKEGNIQTKTLSFHISKRSLGGILIIKETLIQISFDIGSFWITWAGKIDLLFQLIPENYSIKRFIISIEASQIIVFLQKKTHEVFKNRSYSTHEEKGQNDYKQAISEKQATLYSTKYDENIWLTIVSTITI